MGIGRRSTGNAERVQPVPRGARQILHFHQEAQVAPLGASWRIRRDQPLPRRLGMWLMLAGLKLEVGGRLAASYAIAGRLHRDLRVVGSGKEQIVCVGRSGEHAGQVTKIVIDALARDPAALDQVVTDYSCAEQRVADELGPYLAPTSYLVEPVDARARRYALIGRQRRVEIVDSVFHHGGVLSEQAKAMAAPVRNDVADRIEAFHRGTGTMVDILGIGNLVFTTESELPLLIDSIPMTPAGLDAAWDGDGSTMLDEIRRRLDVLRAGG